MSETTTAEHDAPRAKSHQLLLADGGPFHDLQARIGLIKQNARGTFKRAVLFALLAWVPLLVLCLVEGTAFGSAVRLPFLLDFSAYTRFLVAIPLLIIAETIIGTRVAQAAEHFVESGVVIGKDFDRFEQALYAAERRSRSVLAEVVILAIAYIVPLAASRETVLHVSTWHANLTTDGGAVLTAPGWWLFLFAAPLLQFLFFRWLWRLFLWFQFLWRMRRLDLQLYPTHPDEAAGLGFIGETQRFFGILLFAYSIVISGTIGNQLVYTKAPLMQFAPVIAAYVVLAQILVLGPLMIFTPMLLRTKRLGLHQYGTLSTAYTGDFHKKWIWNERLNRDELLGTGDIQSLADLGSSFERVEQMNSVPMNPRTPIHLAIASLLPMVPLLLSVMPLKDILKLLLKVVM